MDLKKHLNRELIRYAVQRAIFCPDAGCGAILDVRRAVLVSEGDRHGISCARCWDAKVSRFATARGFKGWVTEKIRAGDILDGRTLYAPAPSGAAREPRKRRRVTFTRPTARPYVNSAPDKWQRTSTRPKGLYRITHRRKGRGPYTLEFRIAGNVPGGETWRPISRHSTLDGARDAADRHAGGA